MKLCISARCRFPKNERGVALIVALVFLVALTLIGATAARNSGLEERMSSNTRNRDLAFQSAEAALKYVQLNLSSGDNLRSLNFSGSTPGLSNYSAVHGDDAVYWGSTFTWSDSTARRLANTDSGLEDHVASLPQYVIEKMPNIGSVEYYRVTARGVGGESNAVVILQAAYTYTPPSP